MAGIGRLRSAAPSSQIAPERLGNVSVRVGEAGLTLAWASRNELLRWFAAVPAGGGRAVEGLRAVGAIRSVELSLADEGTVLLALERWRQRTTEAGLPPDAEALRHALDEANRRRRLGRDA
jgi:hypothetical protein